MILLFTLLSIFYLLVKYPNSGFQSLGLIATGICILVTIGCALRFHMRREPRGSEATPSVEFEGEERKLTLINPPDKFYDRQYFAPLMRTLLLGYDENVIPDGEVIGDVSEENYRWYSDEEKENWQKEHKEFVAGVREQICRQLESPIVEVHEENDEEVEREEPERED
jgi:hypothetical protein